MHYAVVTNNGSRPVNEDSVGVYQKGESSIFVLCDGLGGHGMGDIASATVKDSFISLFSEVNGECGDFIENAFLLSQQELMTKQETLHAKHRMKTTAVCVATDKQNAYIGFCGDSRCYVFTRNKVRFRTKDHSIPQMLVDSKVIKEKEIRNHPDRNMVMKVMGVDWESPMCEVLPTLPLKKAQAFLLCSDGFWELIEEDRMCRLLKEAKTVEQWLESMTREVEANGVGRNMDNFSAIAVWND